MTLRNWRAEACSIATSWSWHGGSSHSPTMTSRTAAGLGEERVVAGVGFHDATRATGGAERGSLSETAVRATYGESHRRS